MTRPRISYQQMQGDVADEDLVLPGPRKPNPTAEWRTHAAAAKLCYQRERADSTFRFFSAGAEGARTAQRAAMAKMMGQNRRGVPDLWLLRNDPLKLCCVEFKKPTGKLTPEQLDWFAWLELTRVKCYRCDSLEQFREILAEF